jgi:hypothetical protein
MAARLGLDPAAAGADVRTSGGGVRSSADTGPLSIPRAMTGALSKLPSGALGTPPPSASPCSALYAAMRSMSLRLSESSLLKRSPMPGGRPGACVSGLSDSRFHATTPSPLSSLVPSESCSSNRTSVPGGFTDLVAMKMPLRVTLPPNLSMKVSTSAYFSLTRIEAMLCGSPLRWSEDAIQFSRRRPDYPSLSANL